MIEPQFSFYATQLVHRVYILKFFLPEPSGPAKNKKTFEKWTQCHYQIDLANDDFSSHTDYNP